MKKTAITLVLALLLTLALSGCGEDKSNTNRHEGGSSNSGSLDDAAGNSGSGSAADNGGTARSGGYGRYRGGSDGRTFSGSRSGAGREVQKDAEAWPPTVFDTMTGGRGADGAATWRQMLDNGFVHDADGFLRDGDNRP